MKQIEVLKLEAYKEPTIYDYRENIKLYIKWLRTIKLHPFQLEWVEKIEEYATGKKPIPEGYQLPSQAKDGDLFKWLVEPSCQIGHITWNLMQWHQAKKRWLYIDKG